METVVVQVNNHRAFSLLENLEALNVIKMFKHSHSEKVHKHTDNATRQPEIFAESFGMWADRNIDIKEIRKNNYERRTKLHDNGTL
jgi:predicted regulator of amino acid metabolism with ACT domain